MNSGMSPHKEGDSVLQTSLSYYTGIGELYSLTELNRTIAEILSH